jgi:predicted kinase
MIELLIGMIASGKSTYALQRAREGALVVSHDALTQMLHAEYRYEADLRECYRMMEERIAHSAYIHGRDIVIDRTHLTREARARWIGFARTLDFGPVGKSKIVAVVFPIFPAELHARKRFECDPRGRTFEEWLKVAEHHAHQAREEPFTDPTAEGFDRVIQGRGPWD